MKTKFWPKDYQLCQQQSVFLKMTKITNAINNIKLNVHTLAMIRRSREFLVVLGMRDITTDTVNLTIKLVKCLIKST